MLFRLKATAGNMSALAEAGRLSSAMPNLKNIMRANKQMASRLRVILKNHQLSLAKGVNPQKIDIFEKAKLQRTTDTENSFTKPALGRTSQTFVEKLRRHTTATCNYFETTYSLTIFNVCWPYRSKTVS